MSALNQIYSECPAIQAGINDAFGFQMAQEALPQLEFVNSELNTRNIKQLVSPGGAKKRKVKLSFFPRLPESQAVEGAAVCGPFDPIGDNTAEYEITANPVTSGESFTPEDLAEYCSGNSSILNEKLALHLDVIDRAIATRLAEETFALVGGYSQDAKDYYVAPNPDGIITNLEVLEMPTRIASSQEQSGWLETLQQALMMTGYTGGVVGFGGAAINTAFRRALAGCCTNSGLNMQELLRLYGISFAYDKRVAAAFGGQNEAFSTVPGAIQLLSYQLAGWKDGFPPAAQMGSNYVRLSASTRAGVPVDIIFKDECPGNLQISVTADVQTIALPSNMFYEGDNFFGVNYINHFRAKNS